MPPDNERYYQLYVCDTESEKPNNAFEGELVYVKATRKLYLSIGNGVWNRIITV